MKDNRGIIRTKLGSISESVTDDELDLAIEEVSRVIKNYCNILSIPDDLIFTHANMTVDLIRYQITKSGSSSGSTSGSISAVGNISSVKLGDMNLSISSTGTGDSNAHTNMLDDLVLNYKTQLDQFREIWWK